MIVKCVYGISEKNPFILTLTYFWFRYLLPIQVYEGTLIESLKSLYVQ